MFDIRLAKKKKDDTGAVKLSRQCLLYDLSDSSGRLWSSSDSSTWIPRDESEW